MRFLVLFMLLAVCSATAQVKYPDYFTEKALRYDFLLGGDDKRVEVFPQQMKELPLFAGNHNTLTEDLNYGNYRIRLFDAESNKLIFSKGFSPLFMEWQTTAEAKTQNRCFYQSAIMPFPKKLARIEIEQRQWNGDFVSVHSEEINPANYFIIKESETKFKSRELVHSGEPSQCVDLVFLAEGYTEAEMEKFIADAQRMTDYLFASEPFVKYRNKFNVCAVMSPSEESGMDVPGESIYKNTRFNSTFYTFDTPRYLTTSDMKSVYDALDGVPFDHVFLLVNSERYGGGGFYNFVGVGTVDNSLSEKVFVHEFGHSFAGLADEYYNSSVAYDDFYNLKIEPWEPNITTMVDFDSKWKKMIDANTPVPTPRTKENDLKIGLFEGGGYLAKGIYSPMMNCRMKSNDVDYYCPACQAGIVRVIELHTRK